MDLSGKEVLHVRTAMNCLTGKIIKVQSKDGVSLVDLDIGGTGFTALTLETPDTDPYLSPNTLVDVLFKETEVAVARELSGRISLRNRMDAKVLSIEKGELLTRIIFDFHGNRVQAVVTTRSSGMLELDPGSEAQLLIKATEISLRKSTAGEK